MVLIPGPSYITLTAKLRGTPKLNKYNTLL